MGLLDSPFVGQLTKKGTVNVTMSASGWIADPIDCSGYDTITFKLTFTGTVGTGTKVYLKGNVTNFNYMSCDIYKISYNDDACIYEEKLDSANTDGSYIGADLSNFSFCQFWYAKGSGQSADLNIKIEYTLSMSNRLSKVINKNIQTLVGQIKPAEDILISQRTIACNDTNTLFLTGIKSKMNGKKYLRVNVEFSSVDTDVLFYIQFYKQSTTTRYSAPILAENGYYVEDINPTDATKQNRSYYIKNVEENIFARVGHAGASGLTCTINIYATDFCPEVVHIQPLSYMTVSNSTTAQTKTVVFNSNHLRNYKFFFCSIGGGSNYYSLSGSITKNWSTNEDDDSDTLVEFTNKKNVITKWYPVTALSGTITFNLTGGADSGTYNIGVYGVV